MRKLSCNLTGQEFGISDSEVGYYSNRSLELPNISEIERIRQSLAVIPIPVFREVLPLDGQTSSATGEKINTTYFNINADLDTSPLDPLVFNNFSKFREYLSMFIQSFRLFDHIKNFGDPLCYGSIEIQNSFDCNFCYKISDCYDCIVCSESKNLFFSRFSNNCSSSFFLDSCNDCSHCIFCSHLVGAKFCAFNMQLTEVEYQALIKNLELNFSTTLEFEKERFADFILSCPNNTESGSSPYFTKGFPIEMRHDFDVNFFSRNMSLSSSNFCCNNLHEAYNSALVWGTMKDLYSASLIYGKGRKITRSISCFGELEDIDLSIACFDSSHLFACIGLTDVSYCIFNRQIRKSDYGTIVQKMRTMIKEQGLAGRNFLISEKLIPYNKSLASLILPLTKVQAELLGFNWDNQYDAMSIKTDIDDEALVCEISGQVYTVSESEKAFLREYSIAEPTRSPLQRFKDRIRSLEISAMKKTQCAMSGAKIYTWDAHGREAVVDKSALVR